MMLKSTNMILAVLSSFICLSDNFLCFSFQNKTSKYKKSKGLWHWDFIICGPAAISQWGPVYVCPLSASQKSRHVKKIYCTHPGRQRAVTGKHKTSHLVCWLLSRFHWLSHVLPGLLDAYICVFNVYWKKWCQLNPMHFTGKKHIILKQNHYRDHCHGQRH